MTVLSQARYQLSAHNMNQMPPDQGLEVAFAGRSNVGKSSAINRITGQRSLARTSKTPGRTQQIIFFDIEGDRRLVDLPGYGFARVPIAMQQHWRRFIDDYLAERQCLKGLFLPMDCRRPLTGTDQTMVQWCLSSHIKLHVLLTKSDKLKRGPAKSALLQVRRQLDIYPGVSIQLFSALKGDGVDEARQKILQWLELESG